MQGTWAKSNSELALQVGCTSQQLRSELNQFGMGATVANTLTNALPAALKSALPGLAVDATIPSPLRKKGKSDDVP